MPAKNKSKDSTPRPPFPAWRHRDARLRLWIIVVVVVAADLGSKHYVFEWLGDPPIAGRWSEAPDPAQGPPQRPQPHTVVPKFLEFHTSYNEGAALGILQGYGLLFIVAGIAALGLFLFMFARSEPKQWFYQTGIAMVLGGALGNIYDRAVHERVRDFIHFTTKWSDLNAGWSAKEVYPWIWNIADAALVGGVTAIMLAWFAQSWREYQAEKAGQDAEGK